MNFHATKRLLFFFLITHAMIAFSVWIAGFNFGYDRSANWLSGFYGLLIQISVLFFGAGLFIVNRKPHNYDGNTAIKDRDMNTLACRAILMFFIGQACLFMLSSAFSPHPFRAIQTHPFLYLFVTVVSSVSILLGVISNIPSSEADTTQVKPLDTKDLFKLTAFFLFTGFAVHTVFQLFNNGTPLREADSAVAITGGIYFMMTQTLLSLLAFGYFGTMMLTMFPTTKKDEDKKNASAVTQYTLD